MPRNLPPGGVGLAAAGGGAASGSTSSTNDSGAAAAATTTAASTSVVSLDNTSFDSPYGKTIPLLYGDATALGQLIWNNADALSTTAANPFTNFAFAVVFGRPDPNASFVKFKRIFANGILIYDASGAAAVQADTSYSIRIYKGDEAQVADVALANYYGKYAPAFRGLMYLVFDGYDLSKQTTDGKMPQIIAEIEQTGDGRLLVKENVAGPNSPYYAAIADDTNGILTYFGSNGFDVYSTVDGSYVESIPVTPLTKGQTIGGAYSSNAIQPDGNGNYWTFINDHLARFSLTTNIQDIDYVDGNVNRAGGIPGFIGTFAVLPGVGKWDNYLMFAAIANSPTYIYGVKGTKVTFLREIDSAAKPLSIVQGYAPVYPNNLSSYNAVTKNSGATPDTQTVTQPGSGSTGVTAPVGVSYPPGTTPTTPVKDPSAIGLTPIDTTKFIVVYASSGAALTRYIIAELSADGAHGASVLYCCRPSVQEGFLVIGDASSYLNFSTDTTGIATATVATPVNIDELFADDTSFRASYFGDGSTFVVTNDTWSAGSADGFDGTAGWLGVKAAVPLPIARAYNYGRFRRYRNPTRIVTYCNGNDFCIFDISAGVGEVYLASLGFIDVDSRQPIPGFHVNQDASGDPAAGIVFDSSNNIVFVNTGDGSGTALSQVLTSMTEAAGFTPAQVAALGMLGITVQGAIVNQTMGFAALVQSFADFYRFGVFDSVGVITYVEKARNQNFATDWDIAESNIVPTSSGASNAGSDPDVRIAFDRDYKEDLPTYLTLGYLDGANQCAAGVAPVQRTQIPEKTSSSDQSVQLGAPVITDAATANYYAQFALYDIWAQSTKQTFNLPSFAIAYDPTDIIGITLDDGEVLPVQITSVALNVDYSVTVNAKSLLKYNTFAKPGAPVNSASIAKLQKVFPAKLYMPDNILVSPADDTGDGSAPTRWTADGAAYLYVSDGVTFSQQAGAEKLAACVGITVNALSAPADNQWQEPNTLEKITFRPRKGVVPTGTDNNGFFSGASYCFVGGPGRWEMIFFRDVTANADGTYSLGYLARGRRGTDAFMATHGAGDAVFFPTADMPIVRFKPATLETPTQVLCVAAGGTIASSTPQTVTPGGPLMPWRPANLAFAAGVDGAMNFTWNRRTRAATSLAATPSIPLGEAAEEYTILLALPTGATMRVVSVASPSFSYTGDMQQTDGFTGNTLIVTVSQTSASVGDGYTSTATFEVKG